MSRDQLALEICRSSAAELFRTVNTKIVKSLGDLDLGFEVEVGIGKLLALSQCALCVDKVSCVLVCCSTVHQTRCTRVRIRWR